MIKVSRPVHLTPIFLACLILSACGGQDDYDLDEGQQQEARSGDFDESQLPGDFPRELIPEGYSNGVIYLLIRYISD